jgi:hypothetical protein
VVNQSIWGTGTAAAVSVLELQSRLDHVQALLCSSSSSDVAIQTDDIESEADRPSAAAAAKKAMTLALVSFCFQIPIV